MAWILLGVGAVALGWAGSAIADVYDSATKPIYNFFDEREKEKEIYEREARRQVLINDVKDKREKSNQAVSKFVDIDNYQIKLINNTEDPCSVVYVNHDRAITSDDAIKWAKRELNAGMFEKSNTKIETLSPDAKIIFIQLETKEYTIVLNVGSTFVVLNQNDFNNKKIFVKEKFNLEEAQADTNCRGLFDLKWKI
jgi:hypothetical protein